MRDNGFGGAYVLEAAEPPDSHRELAKARRSLPCAFQSLPMNTGPCYVIVTGGVVSSLGKGIAAASLAALLRFRSQDVKLQKLDPYLNLVSS